MVLFTTEFIGEQKYQPICMVTGNTVQARREYGGNWQTVATGEMHYYMETVTAARSIATDRMVQAAEKFGADAIVGIRYTTSVIIPGAIEVLAYGTAVKFI